MTPDLADADQPGHYPPECLQFGLRLHRLGSRKTGGHVRALRILS